MATLEELARKLSAEKIIAVDPQWHYDAADSDAYVLSVPLALDHVIEEGLFLAAHCIKTMPDRNVSLLLLYKPAIGLAVVPVVWTASGENKLRLVAG